MYWGIADQGFPGGSSGKESTCQCRRQKRHGFNPGSRRSLEGRAWQPTPVFLPGESHVSGGLHRSLAGYTVYSVAQSCIRLKRLSVHARARTHTHSWSTNNVVIVSGEQRRDSVIYIHVSILPQTPFPSRSPHNIECYTVGNCWLSILHIAVCTCPSQTA